MASMRHISTFCMTALALGACALGGPETYRDESQPISASSRFDAQAFSGTWLMMATFEPARRAPIAITYVPEVQNFRVASDEAPQIAGLYRAGRPGELVPLTDGRSTLVVMWVDEDFETAAIGTPSGSFGAVLDRDGTLRDDRARAARDIMAFNGWDVAALKGTTP